jgi:hypothetical protein
LTASYCGVIVDSVDGSLLYNINILLMAFLQQPIMAEIPTPKAPRASTTSDSDSFFFSQRARRQLGLFVGGAAFFGLSMAITRKSITRRYRAQIPKFYSQSNRAGAEVNGPFEAFEALSLATVNVFSVGMMLSGGLLWAFDIGSIEDMRGKVRTNMGVDGVRKDQDAEEEIEEFIASVLARKEFKFLRDEMASDKKLEELEKSAAEVKKNDKKR